MVHSLSILPNNLLLSHWVVFLPPAGSLLLFNIYNKLYNQLPVIQKTHVSHKVIPDIHLKIIKSKTITKNYTAQKLMNDLCCIQVKIVNTI